MAYNFCDLCCKVPHLLSSQFSLSQQIFQQSKLCGIRTQGTLNGMQKIISGTKEGCIKGNGFPLEHLEKLLPCELHNYSPLSHLRQVILLFRNTYFSLTPHFIDSTAKQLPGGKPKIYGGLWGQMQVVRNLQLKKNILPYSRLGKI